MSWRATGYIKELSIAPNGELLTRSEKLLLLMLAECHSNHDHTSSLSLEILSSVAGLSDQRTHKLLARLQYKGVIALRDCGQSASHSVSYTFPGLEAKRQEHL